MKPTHPVPLLILSIIFLFSLLNPSSAINHPSPSDLLAMGDSALSINDLGTAIQYYQQGIQTLTEDNSSLIITLSLYTNLGTAYSSLGNEHQSEHFYKQALLTHKHSINEIVDPTTKTECDLIAAQTAFFLGMTYQDGNNPQHAIDAYVLANTLDPNHWSSLANLGSILMDISKNFPDALLAYNKVYQLLTSPTANPTDRPEHPAPILSQIQYRIGLAISHDLEKQCTLQDDPTKKPVSCREMAAHAFDLAVKYDSRNEAAKHMLAAITADATVERASNAYVLALFEDYADNFEHSLVSDLRYSGYETLRLGFDKAFGGRDRIPMFPLVVDAGCGTGLVGEQFRNVSQHLIGIDLSPSIIETAKRTRPGLYDETVVGDVLEFFTKQNHSIDLIIAADSYIYFGDLVPLFEGMQMGLKKGGRGYVAFTLENVGEESEKSLDESKPDWRWQLTSSGRFAHRKEYVERVAERHSFQVMYYEPMDGFRYERGVAVRGHLFVLQTMQERRRREEL